jgi:hypothetical protein
VARFKTLTTFMNRNRGVWLRGENHVVTRSRIADNQGGVTFASEKSYLTRSLVVGESANKGNPEPWEDTGPGGRALPAPWEPEEEITGFEFYDGLVGVSRTHFAEFSKNHQRKAGALGYLSPNAFAIHPKNFAKRVTFRDANRVFLAQPERGMDGDVSKVFVDRSGSVTGKRGAHVVVNNPFLLDGSCKKRDGWNAWVCGRRDYATLWVGTSTAKALDPMKLIRQGGRTQSLQGCCSGSTRAVTTFLPGYTYEVDFSTAPQRAEFVLWRSAGKRVTLRMKAPAGTKVERWGDTLNEVGSVGALKDKDDSAWHYDGATNMLTVRIVSRDDWAEVEVVRP